MESRLMFLGCPTVTVRIIRSPATEPGNRKAQALRATAGCYYDPPFEGPGLDRRHWHLPPRARAHPVVSSGMPGWQITLMAAAALLAAAIAVTV